MCVYCANVCLYDIIHIVPVKNSACQSTLCLSVLNDTSWLFYSFSAEGGTFRRDETKSINHEADIKWRANKIPTDDEDKPMSCFISREKKESRDSRRLSRIDVSRMSNAFL